MKRLFFLLCVAFTMSSVGTALAFPPVIIKMWTLDVGTTTADVSMAFHSDQPCRVFYEVSPHSDLSGARRVHEAWVDVTGSGVEQMRTQLTGLTPNTVYYYQGYLKNSHGEVYSNIESFRTSGGPPSVTFDEGRMSTHAIELQFTCNGYGAEGHCLAMWSTSASMSGAKELKDNYVRPSPAAAGMHASFPFSSVPDNTRVYILGMMKTLRGTAKTGVRDFLIRNAPI